MIDPRSFFALLSFKPFTGSGDYYGNPKGRVHKKMHIRMRRVQFVPDVALRAKSCRTRHRTCRARVLYERHPGALPEHRDERAGL
jgi:hypothetical protein